MLSLCLSLHLALILSKLGSRFIEVQQSMHPTSFRVFRFHLIYCPDAICYFTTQVILSYWLLFILSQVPGLVNSHVYPLYRNWQQCVWVCVHVAVSSRRHRNIPAGIWTQHASAILHCPLNFSQLSQHGHSENCSHRPQIKSVELIRGSFSNCKYCFCLIDQSGQPPVLHFYPRVWRQINSLLNI